MTVEKPHQISGVVRDNDGKPIADAQIYFTDSPVSLPDIAMLTDDNGAFTLSVPSTGKYGIGCNAAGFATETETVTIGNKQEAQLNIRLKKSDET